MIKNYFQTIMSVLLVCFSVQGFAQTTLSFSSTGTWTCPAGVTSITVECRGAGGGGGGTPASTTAFGGGGAGGSYSKSVLTVMPGTVYTITVGIGGTAGANTGTNGGNGGDSWFGSSTTVFAQGGAGGVAGSAQTSGGAGALSSDANNIGDAHFGGGSGFAGSATRSGSGGGGAGTTAAGGDATATSGGAAGASGGGAGATGRTSNGTGSAGTAPGGGGAGGFNNNSTTGRAGGAGGNGVVVISYPGYCNPVSTVATSYFNSFTTTGGSTNISNSASGYAPNGYQVDTNMVLTVVQGNTFSFNTQLVGTTVGVAIWIDWNDNAVFETSERVYATTGYVSTCSGSLTIPTTALVGSHRMRAMMDYNSSSPTTPCSFAGSRGEIEDYTINVVMATCSAPSVLTTANITTNAADVSFTVPSVSPANGYDYYVTTTNTAPIATTTPTGNVSASTVNLSSLLAGTTYYVWVRSRCSASDQSVWQSVTFTTACGVQPIPYFQGFNTAASTTNPNCWSQQNVSGTLNATYATTGSSPAVAAPFEGSRMVYYNSYSNTTSTRLVSENLSSAGIPSVDVNFQWYYSTSGSATSYLTEGVTVQWSTDGVTWNDFTGNFIRRYGATSGWASITMTLPAGAGNQPNLLIGLKLTGNAGYNIYLDALNVIPTPSCLPPTALSATGVTATSANVDFTASSTSPANGYDYYISTVNTAPNASTVSTGNTLATTVNLGSLAQSTNYYVWVRSNCGSGDQSAWSGMVTFKTTLINDNAPGAILLTVGAGCTGAIYDNTNATQSTSEPFPSCKGTAGYAGMWYKFVAPASGAVKVSCDGSGTMDDSRMALFSATDVNDYSTFSVMNCDDDNGATAVTRSLFYATGLTPNQTYYVLVDLYDAATTRGTYCVTVDELSSNMLASAAGDCTTGQSASSYNSSYHGWVSIVDASGNLNANVRQNAGTATGFSASRTIKTDAPRVDANNTPYLNRNFLISASGATDADVQLFFTDAELTNLGASLASLNVSRVSGTACSANFSGTATLLTQASSQSINGANYVQVNTPGFSNFYIMAGSVPLPIAIEYFKGNKTEKANILTWKINALNEASITMELERSKDGQHFASIQQQTVDAARCLSPFEYVDDNASANVNYYRLKTICNDGHTNYSQVVILVNKTQGFEVINIAPNPVKNRSTLNIAVTTAGAMHVVVSDVVGKVIMKQDAKVVEGTNAVEMNFSTLPSGTYQLTIMDEEAHAQTLRIVKE